MVPSAVYEMQCVASYLMLNSTHAIMSQFRQNDVGLLILASTIVDSYAEPLAYVISSLGCFIDSDNWGQIETR
jgi:hypothetical protein